jgi:hypothetical protein
VLTLQMPMLPQPRPDNSQAAPKLPLWEDAPMLRMLQL